MIAVAHTIDGIRGAIAAWRGEGRSVALVPTMGYLHEGHRSLIERAAWENDRVVVSVFVNPMQFGEGEDFARYPRDVERDLALCGAAGAHALFHPEVTTMYPDGFCARIELPAVSAGLCGASRPGHFAGVCTVVCKLLNIVGPDRAYFGQKDAQQLAVIRRMTADLNMPVEIVGCPIVRDPDGLAKSSRNAYLGAEERKAALSLSRSLNLAEEALRQGERTPERLVALMKAELAAEALVRQDYVAIVHPRSMRPLRELCGPVLIALAAWVGGTRLIDNLLLDIRE